MPVETAGGRLWQRDSNGSFSFIAHQLEVLPRRTAALTLLSQLPCLACWGLWEQQRGKKKRGGDYVQCLSFAISLRCIQMDSDPPPYLSPWERLVHVHARTHCALHFLPPTFLHYYRKRVLHCSCRLQQRLHLHATLFKPLHWLLFKVSVRLMWLDRWHLKHHF